MPRGMRRAFRLRTREHKARPRKLQLILNRIRESPMSPPGGRVNVRHPLSGKGWRMVVAKSLCILVAEDHEDSLVAMARLLRHNGHTIYTARTAEQATQLAAANRCDLLIGDIGLPGRSGIELMRDLRARYGLKGIAVSGSTAKQDVTAALEAGYDKYLTKPISFTDLLAAIDELAR